MSIVQSPVVRTNHSKIFLLLARYSKQVPTAKQHTTNTEKKTTNKTFKFYDT